MKRFFKSLGLALQILSLGLSLPLLAATEKSAEGQICEAKPILTCLDREAMQGKTLKVESTVAGIIKDGFVLCDSSFKYPASPDIVLIMDNTYSMQLRKTVNGIPRWCENPDGMESDPGCISGDPKNLRGPALQAFLDSAVVKGGAKMKVGVVTFADAAEKMSPNLIPLNASTLEDIKASIVMKEIGNTNYTAAFDAARQYFSKSTKPKERQFIIFISDGRPYLGKESTEDPFAYKAYWDSLPKVHSIFLGKNNENYKPMQEISRKTGGEFYPISDVELLAKILTDSIANKIFNRVLPTRSIVENKSQNRAFSVPTGKHNFSQDSTSIVIDLPGALYLQKGENKISIKTEYDFADTLVEIRFNIERTDEGPFNPVKKYCREYPELSLLNSQGQAINALGLPYSITDSLVRYTLTTNAPGLDSVEVGIKTFSVVNTKEDFEVVNHGARERKDSTWTGSRPFQHQNLNKQRGDNFVQTDQGEKLRVTYRHPYIPEDSVQVTVKVKYGPDFDHAAFWDRDGDGRIETVDIQFLDSLAHLPEKIKFHISEATGTNYSVMALEEKGEIKYVKKADLSSDLSHFIVTLANPFPFGVTSLANSDTAARIFRQLNIPMVDGTFKVEDSVPPVILSADILKPDKGFIAVRVHYSEPIALDPAKAIEPVVFKRDNISFTASQMPVDHFERKNERECIFYLLDNGPYRPVGGDSIAITPNGETRDSGGRAPAEMTFTPMGGPIPSQRVSDFFVTFSNGSRSDASGSPESPHGDRIFIPVDLLGNALPGNTHGKCGNCIPKVGDAFTGSVFVIKTRYPVVYEFSIYSNLGQFVARGNGKIEEVDLALLENQPDPSHNPNLTEYTQRIVWTGLSQTGQLAGTGAYILKGVFRYEHSFKTGARASLETRFLKFGFLRN